MTDIAEPEWDNHKRSLIQYLGSSEILSAIQEMLSYGRSRLPINLDEIKSNDKSLWADILRSPNQAIRILEPALNEQIKEMNGTDRKSKKTSKMAYPEKRVQYKISFVGNLGRNLVTPRGLSSNLVNSLVGVQGIVTRISLVKPKLIKSYHYCDVTSKGHIREYPDIFDLSKEAPLEFSTVVPTKDNSGNSLSIEMGYCEYKDFQTILVQEMPEKSPPGMLPRSIEIILEDDFVDSVKPGDRVEIYGALKCVTSGLTITHGIFKTYLVANNVTVLQSDHVNSQVTTEEMMKFREIASSKNILTKIARSVAPSIHGHDNIKKSLLLLLLGGIEKNLANGTHLRGDLNILLIGDPSTAKSQMLRHIMTLSPLSVSTTGRGSSGVGLTAAVTYDKDTGERHLEAGAMVLADRGVICIDEFDKMSEGDRVSIHEVMEQQTVTIAKAGIHASLNARCSVVAAANPIYGEYQKDLPPTKNIGLPDSLLSRFDLLFVVLDEKDSEIDRLVAERVTKNHMFYDPRLGEEFLYDDDYVIQPDIIDDSKNEVYEKYNPTLHGANQQELLTVGFIRKYIQYAKKTCSPKLTEESIIYLSNTWKNLRQKEYDSKSTFKSLPITIRTFESLIRLATAHAKLRLSRNVDLIDSVISSSLLHYALFNEEDEDLITEIKRLENPEDLLKQSNSISKNMKLEEHKSNAKNGNSKTKQETKIKVPPVVKEENKSIRTTPIKGKKIKIDEEQENKRVVSEAMLSQIEITPEMKKQVYKSLCILTDSGRKSDPLYLNDLCHYMDKEAKDSKSKLSSDQILKSLKVLAKENKLVYDDSKEEILFL